MIAGVCAGLAQHFGWHLTLLRLVWVLMFLLAGVGGLLYVVLWVVIPSE
jgi:phage shock protein C